MEWGAWWGETMKLYIGGIEMGEEDEERWCMKISNTRNQLLLEGVCGGGMARGVIFTMVNQTNLSTLPVRIESQL